MQTHGESAYNLPQSSPKYGYVVEQSPLEPPERHSQVNLIILFSSTRAQSGTPVTDSKLFEAGAVPPSSKATTSLIPGSSKVRSGIFDKDLSDFVGKAHTRHLELSREQVQYTLISMR